MYVYYGAGYPYSIATSMYTLLEVYRAVAAAQRLTHNAAVVIFTASCPKETKKTNVLKKSLPVGGACSALDLLGLTVGLARLDRLAGLLDLLQNGVVVERVGSGNLGSLVLERDIVRLNTCMLVRDCGGATGAEQGTDLRAS